MSPFEIGLASFGAMVVMVYMGLWVPFALMLSSYVGVWMIKGSPVLAGKLLALAASETISSYFFGVVPLFVLMGYIVSVTGMGRDAFDVANHLFRRFSGGLGIGTVGANAIFAAITGISIASAAVFTRIAVPEMVRHGYSARFSVGVVAGSSVLGMLIPPSLLLILYGLLTEQSVGDLFIAGVIPGLLLAFLFGGGIWVIAKFRPQMLGDGLDGQGVPPLSRAEVARKGLPIATLIALVLGGIYGGFFTPIEAGAVGCAGGIIIGLLRRTLSLRDFWQVLNDTGLVTASICFLIIAAQMYSRMLALSGVPAEFGQYVATADIGYWGVILAYVALVIVMGTVLDSSSIMLILVPLMLPVLATMQVDLIWFGIITIIAVEIGLLTPPFGISVFVIKSALDDPTITLGDIFIGAAQFALLMLVLLGLILAFPFLQPPSFSKGSLPCPADISTCPSRLKTALRRTRRSCCHRSNTCPMTRPPNR
jgi:C4-dicarboxylate transporter DctM subunit